MIRKEQWSPYLTRGTGHVTRAETAQAGRPLSLTIGTTTYPLTPSDKKIAKKDRQGTTIILWLRQSQAGVDPCLFFHWEEDEYLLKRVRV
jgi:hypothetical protein